MGNASKKSIDLIGNACIYSLTDLHRSVACSNFMGSGVQTQRSVQRAVRIHQYVILS